MTQAATTPETPTAPPAAEAFAQEVALLSEMEALSVAFAREFQAHGATALRENKDLAEAGAAETHFSHLFLGMRRSIALKAHLLKQWQKARHAAEDRWDAAQAERAERHRAVARGVIQAIDAATPDAPEDRERLTTELWDRMDNCDRPETDRIDVDRADTVPPIDVLIRQMCRNLGIKPEGPAFAAGTTPKDEAPAAEVEILSVGGIRFRRGRFRRVPSAELGRPVTEHYMLDTDTNEIFPPPSPPLPDLPAAADPGDPGPSAATGPPDGPSDEDLIAAEIRRREAQAWQRLRAAVQMRAARLG
jgi:hypothetical protein